MILRSQTEPVAFAEVFRVAFERRGDYDPTYPSVKPWLLGIAARLVKQQHRTRARVVELWDRVTARATRRARPGPDQRLEELTLSFPVADGEPAFDAKRAALDRLVESFEVTGRPGTDRGETRGR